MPHVLFILITSQRGQAKLKMGRRIAYPPCVIVVAVAVYTFICHSHAYCERMTARSRKGKHSLADQISMSGVVMTFLAISELEWCQSSLTV